MTDHVKKCPFCFEGMRLSGAQQLLFWANKKRVAAGKRPKYKITGTECSACKGAGKITPDMCVTVDMCPGDPILSGR